ncbi:hypothetical protein B0H14DRAFT_2739309 [Mycena olivaceomarginata]|nr:hypothetical protein B0H14DRAFT_2739309 [Mycena olivaceomarginata]
MTHSDPLSAHYSRLESLLDSALATLTLIHDHTQNPDLPALTGHMTEVLQALCRHTVSVHPGTTTTPIPTPALSPSSTRPATYAEVMTGTATDPATISANTPDSTCTPTLPVSPNKAQGPDLIFRFDCHPFNSPPPLARRPHPSHLFTEIKKKSIVGDLQLTSVRWTTKGNLAFTFLHNEHFASDNITKQSPELWKSSGVDAEAISLMCSELDLASQETASLRVSLSSKKHADFLVQNGVLALGSQCRVSHYIPKSKPPL